MQFGVGVSTCDLRTIYPYPKDTSGEVYFFIYITETQEYISLMLKQNKKKKDRNQPPWFSFSSEYTP